LKFHRNLKLFNLSESFIRKLLFLNLLLFFLKNSFEKDQLSKYFFSNLYSNLCKLACKGVGPKGVLFSKDCISRNQVERYFQTLFFIKDYFPFSKDLSSNPI
jgi:hypothetical protein